MCFMFCLLIRLKCEYKSLSMATVKTSNKVRTQKAISIRCITMKRNRYYSYIHIAEAVSKQEIFEVVKIRRKPILL